MNTNLVTIINMRPEYSAIQRWMLLRAHPRKIFFDFIALIWTLYFVWNQSLSAAFFAGFAISLVGTMSVIGASPSLLARTALGKLALLHLHPLNLSSQILGLSILLIGTWQHASVLMLAGLSIMSFGHIYGWEKVDPRFTLDLDA